MIDFERPSGDVHVWEWGTSSVVRAVLEAYAATGVLGLARRDGNRRYYDLLERLLPTDLLAQKVPLHEQLRHKMPDFEDSGGSCPHETAPAGAIPGAAPERPSGRPTWT